MSPQPEEHQDQISPTKRPGRWTTSIALVSAGVVAAVSLTQLGSTSSAAPTEAKLASSPVAASVPGMATSSAVSAPSAAAPAAVTPASTGTPVSAAASPASTISVAIKNYAYSPATLDVKVGDTVTWTNEDTAPHTVTVSSGPVKFASSNLQKGETFSYTFTKAGTYSYYCAVHPDMKASVTVAAGDSGMPMPDPTPTTPADPTPTTPSTGHTMDPAPSSDTCEGLRSIEDTLLQHIYSGHLEESPGQQVQDILAVDQYVKTHLVLVENVLKPLVGTLNSILDTTLQHVYSGHLEESPGQQVQDILAVDQYVKTHTVLVENLLKPLMGTDVSGC